MTVTAEILEEKFSRLDAAYTPEYCEYLADLIAAVTALKRERNAILLAHNYMRPEIYEVADVIGDSLALSRQAAVATADVIVFCGVHFMAETAKILNPTKTVLLPNLRAGCSLADTATAEALEARIQELRGRSPDLAVVGYVNTTAAVKALCDICCTSGNAVRVVNNLPQRHILFVPDANLAAYVQTQTDKVIIPWDGNCYVHHQITPAQIREVTQGLPHVKVLVHPECREDVRALADATLSTEGMVRYARESDAAAFLVVTECGLSDRLLLELPEKTFYKACKLCQYMKVVTMEDVLRSLTRMEHTIEIPEEIRQKAERALTRMFELTQ